MAVIRDVTQKYKIGAQNFFIRLFAIRPATYQSDIINSAPKRESSYDKTSQFSNIKRVPGFHRPRKTTLRNSLSWHWSQTRDKLWSP